MKKRVLVVCIILVCATFLWFLCLHDMTIKNRTGSVVVQSVVVQKAPLCFTSESFSPFYLPEDAPNGIYVEDVFFSPDTKRIYVTALSSSVERVKSKSEGQSLTLAPFAEPDYLSLPFGFHIYYANFPPSSKSDYHLLTEIPGIVPTAKPSFCKDDSSAFIFVANFVQIVPTREKPEGVANGCIETQNDIQINRKKVVRVSTTDGTFEEIADVPQTGSVSDAVTICWADRHLVYVCCGGSVFKLSFTAGPPSAELHYPRKSSTSESATGRGIVGYQDVSHRLVLQESYRDDKGERKVELVILRDSGDVEKRVLIPLARLSALHLFDRARKFLACDLARGMYFGDLSDDRFISVAFIPTRYIGKIFDMTSDGMAIVWPTDAPAFTQPFWIWKFQE